MRGKKIWTNFQIIRDVFVASILIASIIISSSNVSAASYEWNNDGTGWWYGSGSSYVKDQWYKIDGYWYYFDGNGYMASSEWRDGCYLSADGTWSYSGIGSWKSNSTGWWFEDTSGWWASSCWQKIDGKWYHFDGSGYMEHDKTVDGCYLGSDGAWEDSSSSSSADEDGFGSYSVAGGWCEIEVDGEDGKTTLKKITGLNIHSNSEHKYYTNETDEQALKADAVCKYYADYIMSSSEFKTDLERINAAARVSAYFSLHGKYGQDEERHYRSPYGVLIKGVYTCSGSTRTCGRILDYMGYTWTHANENQNSHQWCEVQVGGKTICADGQLGSAYYAD